MTIKLLAVGKTDNRQLLDLIEIYQKRINFYIKYEVEIIPDIKNTKNLNEEQQKQKEGNLLISKIENSDFVVLLDENGKQYASEEFADFLQKRLNSGIKQLVFVIGGPFGFSKELYDRGNALVSLSKMTFSHQMVRLFFAEQVYRGFTILKNEPYHHK
ncbi:MAG TPA: 23S rRNA (pseudouridine(1915)-N(3))-methyltransferase RlmH [Salinimicrobium sp.]|nr:23S rRNA (pseudouridine(1915)-N(3))-methyltransferase RlmH [Salinimicrobium sp.]